jgi:hypothetical protein
MCSRLIIVNNSLFIYVHHLDVNMLSDALFEDIIKWHNYWRMLQ